MGIEPNPDPELDSLMNEPSPTGQIPIKKVQLVGKKKSDNLTGSDPETVRAAVSAHVNANMSKGVRHYIPGGVPTALGTKRQVFTVDTTSGKAGFMVDVACTNSSSGFLMVYSAPTDSAVNGGVATSQSAGPIYGNVLVSKNFWVRDVYIRINYIGALTSLAGMIMAHTSPDGEEEYDSGKWFDKPHGAIRRVDTHAFAYRWKPDDGQYALYAAVDYGQKIFFYIKGAPSGTALFELEVITHFEYVPDDDYRFLVGVSDRRMTLQQSSALNAFKRLEKLDHHAHDGVLSQRIAEAPRSWFQRFGAGLLSAQDLFDQLMNSRPGRVVKAVASHAFPGTSAALSALASLLGKTGSPASRVQSKRTVNLKRKKKPRGRKANLLRKG